MPGFFCVSDPSTPSRITAVCRRVDARSLQTAVPVRAANIYWHSDWHSAARSRWFMRPASLVAVLRLRVTRLEPVSELKLQ